MRLPITQNYGSWLQGALLVSLLSGCIGIQCQDAAPIRLPAAPMNMAPINSPYDDWNCGAPWAIWRSGESILFSSSRKSQGGNFDLVPKGFRLEGEDGVRVDSSESNQWIRRIADRINTGKDELGPSFWISKFNGGHGGATGAFVFSRGDAPNHDLMVLLPESLSDSAPIYGPGPDSLIEIDLGVLNTPNDEGYLTWSKEIGKALFHSNRDGKYRIYQATLPLDSNGPFTWLRNPDSADVVVSQVEGLASVDGEERCPLLVGNRLFFVSDRPGGQGGFDIYRSTWESNSWTPPENLGSSINSSFNEYRPFAFHMYPNPNDYAPDALIFSSDRPGGKGGYDLYLVAMPSPTAASP